VRITIDRERCMGSGNCAFWAPSTFDVDDDMKVVLLVGDGAVASSSDPVDKLRNAVEACPTHALALVDTERA
jgi:ferredoxin